MKKKWLRGMLLGVSLALLLAGGAALAQGFTVTPDQDCIECEWVENGIDEDASVSYTPSPYGVELTLTGHDLVPERLCTVFTVNGEGRDKYCQDPPDIDPAYGYLFAYCSQQRNWVGFVPFRPRLDGGPVAALALPFEYGEWLLDIEQEGVGSDQVTLILAEDCAALEEEFVPEPGTIALLGSGLAGLAGYAALRWRARS
jgi:hypothetical protein